MVTGADTASTLTAEQRFLLTMQKAIKDYALQKIDFPTQDDLTDFFDSHCQQQ